VDERLRLHFDLLVHALTAEGGLVPLLGAGVNRLKGKRAWSQSSHRYPDGGELAQHLIENLLPMKKSLTGGEDLSRVSQYFTALTGRGRLYEVLNPVFKKEHEPTELHHLLAQIPGLLRKRQCENWPQLTITTNYDDLLERAYDKCEEAYDLVIYCPDESQRRGTFYHVDHEKRWKRIDDPATFDGISLRDRSVILKIHGSVNRAPVEDSGYLITEDDYLDYLSYSSSLSAIPGVLKERLGRCSFLFLAYGMRDWNIRLMLHQIWSHRRSGKLPPSWLVAKNVNMCESKVWEAFKVDAFRIKLEDYVPLLEKALHGEKAHV
jgi:SIR2-like domain